MSRSGFVVAGSVAFDTVGTVADLPARDETARVLTLDLVPGGAGGNVALALARLGARPVRLLASVGDDFAGTEYEGALLRDGVDLSRLARSPVRTAHAVLMADARGSQHIYFFPGASADLSALAPAPAAIGHFAAGDFRAYPKLMDACDVVSFDPGQELFHRPLAEAEACFPRVRYLFVNEHELARLRHAGGWTVASLHDEGVELVIESRGASGTRLHAQGAAPRDVPALPVAMKDPTGAGDAHRAGFLAAVARGAGPDVAARFANVVASFAIEKLGPQTGLPTLKDAEARHHATFGAPPFA